MAICQPSPCHFHGLLALRIVQFSGMGTEERIIFGEPSLGDAEAAEVTDSLQSSWIGTGPKVAQFEEQFLAYKEAQYGVCLLYTSPSPRDS